MANPIELLTQQGQSIWLDLIRREMLENGEEQQLIWSGIRGQTSNPAIFEKAMGEGHAYDKQFAALASRDNLDVKDIYEQLAISDIRIAADLFQGVYEKTEGRDGYVSLEVSPYLAFDTQGTIEEGRRLWAEVERPNLMIKVPGTSAGIPAIEELISEGINVNVTLLFARDMYQQAAEAYVRGLERLAKKGKPIDRVASVASFFVSRIDTLADKKLEAIVKAGGDKGKRAEALLGKAAIANAKLAYKWWQSLVKSTRWQALAAEGARPQRLLWASTGTKNPKYRDVVYVEELVGPETVNTLPLATFKAFAEHGEVRASLLEKVDEAEKQLKELEAVGVSLKEVTDTVAEEAVKLFCDPFDKLLGTLEKKRRCHLGTLVNAQEWKMSNEHEQIVTAAIDEWRVQGKVRKLWDRDASLWTGKDEAKWLGWLDLVVEERERLDVFAKLRKEFKGDSFLDVVLLGMGGSSLAPEVLETLCDCGSDFPTFHVLDSTDPSQVRALDAKLKLDKTLFIVSSKSGSTLEPNIFFEYFFDRVAQTVGADKAARQFIAVTDPGSALEKQAKQKGFRHIFHGKPSVGGRYSALSAFGLVPAAVMGYDVKELLDSALLMRNACGKFTPAPENPGVQLGILLGTLATKAKRDKVTFITSPEIWDLGSWLEQLIAESTGKQGKALIPISEEEIGDPKAYGHDRVFVYLKLEGSFEADLEPKVQALRDHRHPVVTIHVNGANSIGQEFFRWEIATAVAGSILGINPFDQPDVEASKVVTRQLTEAYEKSGSLPKEEPFLEAAGLKLYADEHNMKELRKAANGGALDRYLAQHFARIQDGDYFAILAYLEMSLTNEMQVQEIRHLVRDAKNVATCAEFGPRFLHSTGQAYKGGPNNGVFLVLTCDEAQDVPIPGRKLTFGTVKAAQARGDLQVLVERHRRVLRVHLPANVEEGLGELKDLVAKALGVDAKGTRGSKQTGAIDAGSQSA